ncbi:hypothetical protein D3C85_1566590 [compost metagenome]
MASVSIFAALACLPNSQSSSMKTPMAFLPVTVAESAATTFKVALFRRSVMVRMCSCSWKRASNSSSALIMSRIGL